MEFNLKEANGELYVTCTIPPALKNNPSESVNTAAVLNWVVTNHPEYEVHAILKAGSANNAGQRAGRTGTWVFSLTPPMIEETTVEEVQPPWKQNTTTDPALAFPPQSSIRDTGEEKPKKKRKRVTTIKKKTQ